jgi:hypothetical protein
VACQAARVGGDGARQIKRSPDRAFALADELLLAGIVAEVVDDVRLPVFGAVDEIRGIQRCFLVRVVGEILAQTIEGDRRGVKGNGLWQEGICVLRRVLRTGLISSSV